MKVSGSMAAAWVAVAVALTTGAPVMPRAEPSVLGTPSVQRFPANPGYGAGFIFTRIRYGGSGFGFRRGGSSWSLDYPRADSNLSLLLTELTTIDAETGGTNVLEIGDPELFKYPVAYISEPGFWDMTDRQAVVLRQYVLKGGFLILDDFERRQLDNALHQLARALPEYEPIHIDIDHPIFHSFFSMEDIYFPHPLVNVIPVYYALFEDNDPRKRMLAIINHNNDIAEYWEWSAESWFPVDITNDAYKLGINYITYAMTH